MAYHLEIIDCRNIISWVLQQSDRTVVSTKKIGDLKAKISTRLHGDTTFLDDAAEILRQVIRFDHGRGVSIYFIRFASEPTPETYNVWDTTLAAQQFWVRRRSGVLEGLSPWGEYRATREEYQSIIHRAWKKEVLKWPIVDPKYISLTQGGVVPSPSTSGAVTAGSGTTPDLPVVHEATSSGPMEIDSPSEDVEMEFPVPLAFSPTIPGPSLTTMASSPGQETNDPVPSSTSNDVNVVDDTLSMLDRSKLLCRRPHFPMPAVVDSALISEASVVYLDPTSAEEVLSAQLHSREILATQGLIILRPRRLIESTVVDRQNATDNATHYTLKQLETTKSQFLGWRGSRLRTGGVVPPCTFTQIVNPHTESSNIFNILYGHPSSGTPTPLDEGGVELSYFWLDQPRQPPLPQLDASDWPPSLSDKAIDVLSKFPKRFHRVLNPQPIHGTDIAGDGSGRSVYSLLVPKTNQWHQLPSQLSDGLNVLADRAQFVELDDLDASIVPLAHVGRLHLIHGLTQSPAGVPLAQYHMAGSRRIWIAVASSHRPQLSRVLPKRTPPCFWRHGNLFIGPRFLSDHNIPFSLCVQNPGDVILIGGSTLYESYDEGPNVILSVPYLDQQAYDTINSQRLASLDTCDCSADSRNNIVAKRARVLQSGLIMDVVFNSDSPLTDIMDTEGPSIALDGPSAEDIASSMEPDGHVVLQDYEKRGVIIANLDSMLSSRPEDLVGEVPRIKVDMSNEEEVTKTRLKTQKLTEQYGGVIFQQHPALEDKWSDANSMVELKKQLASVSLGRKTTLGRLDANDGTTTDIQQNIYHTTFHPLRSYQASWKRERSASFDWDGLYALDKSQGFRVHENDPYGKTPFEQCWDRDTGPLVTLQSVEDRFSRLPTTVRSQLESLPADLSIWNQHASSPYCAGIGANSDEEHILKLVDHPLQDALAHLPQALMMIALHHRSLGSDPEDLDLPTIQSIVNEAASGTIFPWGYGGNHRTVFGIHLEDAWMPSANLHVAGAPKIWLFIRKDDFRRLYDILSPVLFPCFTFHRCLFIHPRFLIRHNIRFTVARQGAGDMIIAGSTSAHLGWNAGPNLAVAANFLDTFSIDIIHRDVMQGKEAPWPCACGIKELPRQAAAQGTTMDLPRHLYMHENVSDVGSTIFEWIYRALPYKHKSKDFLHTDTGEFAHAWRYLHEIDGDDE